MKRCAVGLFAARLAIRKTNSGVNTQLTFTADNGNIHIRYKQNTAYIYILFGTEMVPSVNKTTMTLPTVKLLTLS